MARMVSSVLALDWFLLFISVDGMSEAGKKRTIVIVGGVAGGASAATRARRMNEHAEIILVNIFGWNFRNFRNNFLNFFR